MTKAEKAQRAGVQIALAILEARRFKQPGSYRAAMGEVSDGLLNTLVAELREADGEGNYPVKVALGKYDGEDWLVADFGAVSRDAQCAGGAIEADVHVTTDRVHASEIRGDALCDAECYVVVRNHLPTIIAALEELLAARLERRQHGPAGADNGGPPPDEGDRAPGVRPA